MLKIEKHLSKLSNYLGFKTKGERGVDPKQESLEQLELDTGGAKPLAEHLLYEYAADDSGVFWLGGAIGCFFEIDPLVGSDDGIEKNLTLFINDDLPTGGYLQFLLVAGHDVSGIIDVWEQERKYGGEVIDKLTKYRKHFVENLAKDFSSSTESRLARNYRIFVCYSQKDDGDKGLKELVKFRAKLENKLKAERLNPRACKSEELIHIGRDILQMNFEPKKPRKYSPINPLADQIVEPLTMNTVLEDKIIHEDTGLSSKIFAPGELPESFSLNSMIRLLGDEHKTIPARFVISYTLANSLGTKGTSSIITNGKRSIHAASKEYTRNDTVAQEEASEWVEVLARHKKGEIFLEDNMLIMITAPDDQIEIAEEVLKSLYYTHDWKLKLASKVQRLTSLAMMPMAPICYWRSMKFFRLTRYALSGDVVAKLPLQGEWKGVPKSGALLMGRRGQLFNFNPFYRIGGGGNYNTVLMAPSGAGKSFFLQELVQSMIAGDVAVFVMDIGASYKNMCSALNGEMVRFNHETNISLNPFAALSNNGGVYIKAAELIKQGKTIEEISEITSLSREKIEALKLGASNVASDVKETDGIEVLEVPSKSKGSGAKSHFVTKDSIIYAKSMVAAMCGVAGCGREEALIERAIVEGVANFGDKLDITKLKEILENLKDKKGNITAGAASLADHLYPYTEDGIHGRFFKASSKEATFKGMFTVFELEELVNDEPLLAVVLQVVLMQITMQFLCGDRSRRFMLVVDEAWMILDYAASFLERFARTVRKYGGSLVVCTQDLSSFSNIDGTKKSQAAVLECSTWKLIMQQKSEGLEAFAKSRAYEKYLGLIASVRKCSNNKFSEILINTDGATVVGRLATDPYSTAMFSTEDKDYQFLLSQEKAGVPKHEAILALSRKYGELPDLPEQSASDEGNKDV